MSLPFSPSSERNKQPIASVLLRLLPSNARVLEIGSGTGQHVQYFLVQRPDLEWTATEIPDRLPAIEARLSGFDRRIEIRPLVVGLDRWPDPPFDAVFTANTLHIMPWSCSVELMEQASNSLKPRGRLFCYGPFADRGRHNSDGNRAFDRSLRLQDAAMGIRDLSELRRLGADRGLSLVAVFGMPANNRLLVFERR